MSAESRKPSKAMEMEHTYHDFSNVAAEDEDAIQSLLQIGMNNGNVVEEGKSLTNWDAQNFPVQLHFALSEMDADGLGHLASWAPHGRCFYVHKKDEFVDMILCRYVVSTLPNTMCTISFRASPGTMTDSKLKRLYLCHSWFRQTKFTSFQRQLNIYGFNRITHGEFGFDCLLVCAARCLSSDQYFILQGKTKVDTTINSSFAGKLNSRNGFHAGQPKVRAEVFPKRNPTSTRCLISPPVLQPQRAKQRSMHR
jgi:HSF-type DNA-binding